MEEYRLWLTELTSILGIENLNGKLKFSSYENAVKGKYYVYKAHHDTDRK